MKRALGFLTLLLTVSGGTFALDWGVNLGEVPLMMWGQTNLGYENTKAQAWLSSPVSGMKFRIEGEAGISASTADLYTPNRNLTSTAILDLNELSLSGLVGSENSGAVEWNLGRRSVTDLTGGWLIDSRWDGASATGQLGQTKLGASVGYSGLLLNSTARVAGSPADLADQSDTSLLLAPKRLYGSLTTGLNEAFLRQDFQVELLGDYDFRSGDQAVHGLYLTGLINGPMAGGLRERLWATGSRRDSLVSSTFGLLTGTELSYNFLFLGSRLALSGTGAWGFRGFGFQAISGDGLADIVSLTTAHGASVKLDYSIRPLSGLLVGGKVSSLWRTSLDVPVLSGFKLDSGDYWLGTETGLYGSWNPTSDLALGASGGVFFGQPNAFVSDTKPTGLAALTLTLKL